MTTRPYRVNDLLVVDAVLAPAELQGAALELVHAQIAVARGRARAAGALCGLCLLGLNLDQGLDAVAAARVLDG